MLRKLPTWRSCPGASNGLSETIHFAVELCAGREAHHPANRTRTHGNQCGNAMSFCLRRKQNSRSPRASPPDRKTPKSLTMGKFPNKTGKMANPTPKSSPPAWGTGSGLWALNSLRYSEVRPARNSLWVRIWANMGRFFSKVKRCSSGERVAAQSESATMLKPFS